MPFHGVLPHRQWLFQPHPKADVGVNDAHAWRLNPDSRHVYNKLFVATAQGLMAAPCGLDPKSMGIANDTPLFVKPITNLSGMSLEAGVYTASTLPNRPGSFWCEYLQGQQTSSDCLVLNGQAQWFAHTLAAPEKNKQRPVYWHIGVELPQLEPIIARFIQQRTPNYTGICNVEMIGDYIIEMHLRGSNAFYDFYGEHFIETWVKLIDEQDWQGLDSVEQGYVYSVFGEGKLADDAEKIAETMGIKLWQDKLTPDRLAVCYGRDLKMLHAFNQEIVGFVQLASTGSANG